jgi:hypothetical protein
MYLNGVSVGSVANTTNFSQPNNIGGRSGQYFTGYLSNVRFTNTAVYTSAFTPSTVPLSAITGTQLLTLQNASIVDNSTNAFTITNNGSVTTTNSIQPFASTITGYAYTFNNSGYLTYTNNTFLNYAASFNGSNKYLTVGTNSNWTFLNNGSSNFTVECWFNVPSVSSIYTIMSTSTATVDTGMFIAVNNFSSGDVSVQIDKGTSGNTALTIKDLVGNKFSANTWNHLAVVFNSSTSVCTVYMNGVSILSATGSNFPSSAPTYTLAIGRDQYASPVNYFNGYISNLRITNTILYTSNFTPSTTHLTAVSGTQLLTCQNAALVDNSTNNFTITNNNSVTTTYTQVPFNY